MGFKLGKVVESRHPIPLNVKYYVATDESAIEDLPRAFVDGKSGDPISDAPCWYSSECVVATGSATTAYILNADNEWTKL